MRQVRDRSNELWAFLPNESKPNTKLAIFVHGFIGNYLDTWGGLPKLLAENADKEAPFESWDFLFMGYDTGQPTTFLDIASLVGTKWEEAATGGLPLGRKYDALALLGHSLGTLGIRQLLCAWSLQPAGMDQALHSVTLFGTPVNGSPLAKFGKLRYNIAKAIEPGNPQITMLRTWLKGAEKKQPWPPVRIVLGLDDQVVGYENTYLVEWPGDRSPITMTNFDHRALVKPTSWDKSQIITYVRQALQ